MDFYRNERWKQVLTSLLKVKSGSCSKKLVASITQNANKLTRPQTKRTGNQGRTF